MLQNYVKNKEPERQELSELVKTFLAQGKEIQVIESDKDPKPSKKAYVHGLY